VTPTRSSSALVDGRTRGRDFVVVDGGLAVAAAADGFNIIVPRG
jgi:hypothetical protein